MHHSKVTIVFLLLILPSIASMQTVASTSEQIDEGLYFGGQKGSILEGAIFSGSGHHECAIVDQNSIECWGSNQYGQFGNGQSYQNPSHSHSMVNLPSNVSSVHEISSGYNFNCAIVNYGSVICWGSYDPSGSTGDWNHYTPVYVDLPSERIAVSIDSLSGGATVILDDGTIYCLETLFACNWGLSQVNTWSTDFTPFTEVIAFGGNDGGLECVALANSSIFCINGSLGVGNADLYTHHWINRTRPLQHQVYTGLANQSHSSFSMSVGSNHLCWILMFSYIQAPSSTLMCYGVHGVHSARSGVISTTHVISVSSGIDHTCFLISNGSVYCAGDNHHGQLGPNAPVYYSSSVHVPLPDGKLATAIYSNQDSSCAASTDGALYCWGDGFGGSIVTIPLSSSLQLLNRDADNDGVLNVLDLCSEGESNWQSSNSTDYDHDGCRDSSEDFDDDNDLILDNDDSCPTSSWVFNWNDKDMYGVSWSHPSISGSPHWTFDTDGDGCHNTEDLDDDNDGTLDEDDIFWFDSEEWADNDGDGNSSDYPGYAYKWWPGQTYGGDNWDMDDDNDGWSDAWESACLTDSMNSDSVPLDTDDDSDNLRYTLEGWGGWYTYGIANMNETTVGEILNGTFSPNSDMLGCDLIDIDDDGDLVNDTEDAFPLNRYEWLDTDGDEIGNNADYDDDGDGYNDTSDAFPLNVSEWSDTDGDGIGNNADTDDDDDGYTDNLEIGCGTDSLDANNTPPDFDEDSICDLLDPDDDDDGRLDDNDAFPKDQDEQDDWDSDGIGDNEDLDDDGDRVEDVDDFCPRGETNWISGAALETDLDGDGCRDDGEYNDDDGDGVEDADDGCPRGHTGWTSNPANDIDGDGCHETEDYDRDGDGFSDDEDSFPEDPTEWYDSDGDGIGDNEDAYPNDSTRWELNDDEAALENKSTILLLLGAILVLLIAAVVIVLRRK